MISQQLVHPKDIESELRKMWDELGKQKKTRACLFNLIVYTKLNKRSDYFREIVQKVIENFPCRVLFISSDPDFSQKYLKTAVSVISVGKDSQIACDNIDIGVAGEDYHRVPFVVLPNLICDLPIYMLWAEDPCLENPLFTELGRLTHRILFDSESSENLLSFADMIRRYLEQKRADVADLNWARMEPWRDLLASQFFSDERLEELSKCTSIECLFNSHETEYFCHLRIQSLYLIGWLATRLEWKWEKKERDKLFLKGKNRIEVIFKEGKRAELTPGSILGVKISTKGHEFSFLRDEKQVHRVTIHTSSQEECDLPVSFDLGKDVRGLSLSNEIMKKGTSKHYIETLHFLSNIKDESIC